MTGHQTLIVIELPPLYHRLISDVQRPRRPLHPSSLPSNLFLFTRAGQPPTQSSETPPALAFLAVETKSLLVGSAISATFFRTRDPFFARPLHQSARRPRLVKVFPTSEAAGTKCLPLFLEACIVLFR